MAKSEALLKKFLAENDIVIVDKSHASKNRLAKTLIGFGANKDKIHLATEFEQAKAIVKQTNSNLVIADYYIENGSGFDLFKEIRETGEAKNKVFILITSNLSQGAVARAAEEDVDSFILKPYTVSILQENLAETIDNRLNPSDYMTKINEGKRMLEEGKYEEAQNILLSAQELNEKPSLAHYYKGALHSAQDQDDEAIADYNKGVEINNIHFKCKNGLYETYMKQNRHNEAYLVMKDIIKYFPSNHERLSNAIRLAIVTKNLEDIEFFYEVFANSEEKEPRVINHICAGMFVVARHYLLQSQEEKAMILFRKIGNSFGNFHKFITSIIETLCDFQIFSEAKLYLEKYPSEVHTEPFYELANFLVEAHGKENQTFCDEAEEMVKRGHTSYVLLKMIIKAFYKGGNPDRAKIYMEQAKQLYPEKLEELDSMNPETESSEAAA
jgi:tetratricopeptide (TPR) repeat protein